MNTTTTTPKVKISPKVLVEKLNKSIDSIIEKKPLILVEGATKKDLQKVLSNINTQRKLEQISFKEQQRLFFELKGHEALKPLFVKFPIIDSFSKFKDFFSPTNLLQYATDKQVEKGISITKISFYQFEQLAKKHLVNYKG